EVNRCVGHPTPRPHIEPIHPDIGSMWTGRFMECHQGIRQTYLPSHDGCFAAGEADGHSGLAAGDRHWYEEFLLFDQVLDESDLAADTRFFKRGLKRVDQRPSRKRLQVSWKGKGGYEAGGGNCRTEARQPGVHQ